MRLISLIAQNCLNIRYFIAWYTDGDLRARYELPLHRLRGHLRRSCYVHRIPAGLSRSQTYQHVRISRETFRQKDQIVRFGPLHHRYRK